MKYIVTNSVELSTSFTKAYCRSKDCLNLHEPGGLFCKNCISEVRRLNTHESDDKRFGTWIYFMRVDGLEPIKIGHAADINKRLANLQTGVPNKVSLLAKFAGFKHSELILHTMFEEHRVRGEWFNPAPEVMNMIDGINKGHIPEYLITGNPYI